MGKLAANIQTTNAIQANEHKPFTIGLRPLMRWVGHPVVFRGLYAKPASSRVHSYLMINMFIRLRGTTTLREHDPGEIYIDHLWLTFDAPINLEPQIWYWGRGEVIQYERKGVGGMDFTIKSDGEFYPVVRRLNPA